MFRRFSFAGLLAAVSLVLGSWLTSAQGQSQDLPLDRLRLPANLVPDFGLAEVNQALGGLPQFHDKKTKTAARDKSRGFSEELYEKAAPAICLVQKPGGFGTGFFIHSEGWLLTNDHVVEGTFPDPKTGALMVYIHLGSLNKDGEMELTHQKIPALVYKTSPTKDLALVKLLKSPLAKLATLSLAERRPKVGTNCTVIGHPGVGVLWTTRNGQVSGVGDYPDDRLDFYLQKLWSETALSNTQVKEKLKKLPQRKIVLSNIGIAPGDSGEDS